jgi:hypothetical protein
VRRPAERRRRAVERAGVVDDEAAAEAGERVLGVEGRRLLADQFAGHE